ncbi:MAG: hypothetical protein HN909_08740 [Phycisphaerales bacterium]|jgi:hypothetical protein|nr:hypothetical protein [Phycisphaerales bacterium]MBT7171839.1 hypothetical protein [Phycisphaerales bacterium]
MMISGDTIIATLAPKAKPQPRESELDTGFELHCPHCHEAIEGVCSIEGHGVGDPSFDEHLIYHCCPKCHTILNVEIDPLQLLRRTEGHLRHAIRQISGKY